MSGFSHLNDPQMTRLIVAALVHKLGGSVSLTQEDIDAVAYNELIERGGCEGVRFNLVKHHADANSKLN